MNSNCWEFYSWVQEFSTKSSCLVAPRSQHQPKCIPVPCGLLLESKHFFILPVSIQGTVGLYPRLSRMYRNRLAANLCFASGTTIILVIFLLMHCCHIFDRWWPGPAQLVLQWMGYKGHQQTSAIYLQCGLTGLLQLLASIQTVSEAFWMPSPPVTAQHLV